jgi:hypothetical protein
VEVKDLDGDLRRCYLDSFVCDGEGEACRVTLCAAATVATSPEVGSVIWKDTVVPFWPPAFEGSIRRPERGE